ncbi:hypothetical protein IE4771_PB00154 (plasmid) [Rhizobium etli bv. mimosae str. IE4771]|uniref:Uncharacterized protein n=1 Tax=Rhizobium etli bv. mimosae str. IE4771 TaxID=1432050 RepID=A0A060ICU2_RHIET|nr:hypothetical protein IE4771_PB00154 [Rhizobium sp. IE4771]
MPAGAARLTAKACHLRRQTNLVYENRPLWIEIKLAIEPGVPPLQDIRLILLPMHVRTFQRFSNGVVAKHPVGRLMGIRRSRNRRSPISSSVTSLRSSIISTMPRARRSLKTFASLATVPSAPIAGSFDPARIAVEIERRPGRRLAALTCLPQTPLNLALQIIAQRSCDYHLYHVDVGTSFGPYYQLAIDSLIAGLL